MLDPVLKVPLSSSLPPGSPSSAWLQGDPHGAGGFPSGFEFVPNAQLLVVYIIYHVPNSSSPSIPVDIDILVSDKK